MSFLHKPLVKTLDGLCVGTFFLEYNIFFLSSSQYHCHSQNAWILWRPISVGRSFVPPSKCLCVLRLDNQFWSGSCICKVSYSVLVDTFIVIATCHGHIRCCFLRLVFISDSVHSRTSSIFRPSNDSKNTCQWCSFHYCYCSIWVVTEVVGRL